MTFTSGLFFVFLPLVFASFCWTGGRWRWLALLIASYVFYASFKSPFLLVSLALVTSIAYAGGLCLGRAQRPALRSAILGGGVLLCLAVLFFAKYLPHFRAVKSYGPLGAILSIGVSYYTFQAISYLIDVRLGVQEPERHLGYFALYMAFFPKLLQGPIERAEHLLPQLRIPYRFDYDNFRSGLLLFTWGLFCKVVIADRVAVYVNSVYDNVQGHAGLSLVLATYCYAVQIYCDFAGYTDMARGTARLFNIDLAENFNRPYAAASVAEFWRRWHMSFSRWILDYIFKPLQLQWRSWGVYGTAAALVITFLASGIWHGASWGFIVWGLLHGIYLASSVLYRPYQKELHAALGVGKSAWYRGFQTFCTFNLVSFAWIFFRANRIEDAIYVVRNLAGPPGRILLGEGFHNAVPLVLAAMVLAAGARKWAIRLQEQPALFRWPVYLALSYATIIFGVWGSSPHFVYFAF